MSNSTKNDGWISVACFEKQPALTAKRSLHAAYLDVERTPRLRRQLLTRRPFGALLSTAALY